MPITYAIRDKSKGQKIHTKPCEWNQSGVFILTEDLSQKDLRYLHDVIGIQGIEKREQVVQKKKIDVEQEQNIQDNNKI